MFPIPSPRIILAGIAVAALMATAGGLYLRGRSDQATRDKAAVAASREQARVSDVTTKALDTHTVQVHVIKERESVAIRTVQAAPGAGDLLPPDLRDALLRGLSDIAAGPADRGGAVEP